MAEEFAKRVLQKVQVFGANMLTHVCSAEGEFIKVNWLSASLSTAISGMTFPLCLGTFQSAVFRPLRITSNLRIVSLFCGSVSVAIAGGASSLVFLSSVILFRENEDSSGKKAAGSVHSQGDLNMTVKICPKDAMLYGVASLVVFKIFGGKFRMVLPSSLFHPGAFARAFIRAKGQSYASDTVKQKLTSLGKKYGCHSCGRRWRKSFVGDHMPPNKLVKKANSKQRFFPQCTRCSNQQGAALSTMSRQLRVMSHGSSLRLYHLWLPLPIPLALLRNHIGMNSQTNHTAPDIQSETSDNSLQGLLKDALVSLRLKSKDEKDDDSDGKR